MKLSSLQQWIFPIIFLFVTAALSARAYHDRQYLAVLSRTPPAMGGSLSASDLHGQPIVLDTPKTDRFVFFVLHSAKLDAELAFWQKVQLGLPARVGLVGVCENAVCAEQLSQRQDLSFPVAVSGSYNSMLASLRQDGAGQIPICGPQGNILTTVRNADNPATLVTALTGGINGTRH